MFNATISINFPFSLLGVAQLLVKLQPVYRLLKKYGIKEGEERAYKKEINMKKLNNSISPFLRFLCTYYHQSLNPDVNKECDTLFSRREKKGG